MNKIGKIASLIVIIACLGSLFFTFTLAGKKTEWTTQITQLNESLTTTSSKLDKSESDLKQRSDELTLAKNNLDQAVATLQATKVAFDQKSQEADGLKTQFADATKQLDEAKAELATSKDTLAKVQESLAKVGGDVGMEQIGDKITALTDENKVLGEQLASLNQENQTLKQKIEGLTMTPVGVRGHVLVVQDDWGFLVLDVGRSQRVAPNTEFLVYRDTKFIGKVQVVTVALNNSIAQILPDYRRGTPRIGDVVVH